MVLREEPCELLTPLFRGPVDTSLCHQHWGMGPAEELLLHEPHSPRNDKSDKSSHEAQIAQSTTRSLCRQTFSLEMFLSFARLINWILRVNLIWGYPCTALDAKPQHSASGGSRLLRETAKKGELWKTDLAWGTDSTPKQHQGHRGFTLQPSAPL